MKRCCILLCIFLLLSGCAAEMVSTEKGSCVFGAFVTTDLTGEPVNESVFAGHKLTMVNIWATFCNPCIGEMPELAQLRTEYGDGFQVIGIVVDAADRNGNILPERKTEAAAIVEAAGADYLHLLPSRSLNGAYLNGVQSVPETVFVDESGNRIGVSYYGARNKVEWKTIIDAMLESLS